MFLPAEIPKVAFEMHQSFQEACQEALGDLLTLVEQHVAIEINNAQGSPVMHPIGTLQFINLMAKYCLADFLWCISRLSNIPFAEQMSNTSPRTVSTAASGRTA